MSEREQRHCLACGEPWSRNVDDHQSSCEVRTSIRATVLLHGKDDDDAWVYLEDVFAVDFDDLGDWPEGGAP